MSKSGLYAHFGSKQELQLATVEEADRILAEEVVRPALAAPPGLAQLVAVCEAFFDYLERLGGIGLLGIGVAAAVYVAGRLHLHDYSFSMFGTDPVPPKSLLATIVLSLAVLEVLLALWTYRKLPLAGRPSRPVPVTHRVTGFALFALTVPVAVHCLIAYGVQLSLRWGRGRMRRGPCHRHRGGGRLGSADDRGMRGRAALGASAVRAGRLARCADRGDCRGLVAAGAGRQVPGDRGGRQPPARGRF